MASRNLCEPEVIVISDSDSDSNACIDKTAAEVNYKSVFDEFVAHCHELMIKVKDEKPVHKIEKHLLKVHKTAKPEYVSSEEFINTLKKKLVELRKPELKSKSVFTHVHDVIVHLKNAAVQISRSELGPNGAEANESCAVPVVSEGASVSGLVHVNGHCGEKPKASTDAADIDTPGKDSKWQKIHRLEKLMGRLDREIKKYSEKEISLADMDQCDSAHMIEHKLRRRFVEAWQKWCKLKGYEAKTGRVTEKKMKFDGTRYPEINRQIQKLIRHKGFPDFSDVHCLIEKTNRIKQLGIPKVDVHVMAKEVFEDVGELFRKCRTEDLRFNFGYVSLLDVPKDPADGDCSLQKVLEENAARGNQMMNTVLQKFTDKQNALIATGANLEAESDDASNSTEFVEESGSENESGVDEKMTDPMPQEIPASERQFSKRKAEASEREGMTLKKQKLGSDKELNRVTQDAQCNKANSELDVEMAVIIVPGISGETPVMNGVLIAADCMTVEKAKADNPSLSSVLPDVKDTSQSQVTESNSTSSSAKLSVVQAELSDCSDLKTARIDTKRFLDAQLSNKSVKSTPAPAQHTQLSEAKLAWGMNPSRRILPTLVTSKLGSQVNLTKACQSTKISNPLITIGEQANGASPKQSDEDDDVIALD